MTASYRVTLQVSGSVLNTLLQVVENTKGITLENVATMSAGEGPADARTSRYANGKRFKGISAQDLIVKVVKENGSKPTTMNHLKSAFKANGFAENSAAASLSTGVKLKKFIYTDEGHIKLK